MTQTITTTLYIMRRSDGAKYMPEWRIQDYDPCSVPEPFTDSHYELHDVKELSFEVPSETDYSSVSNVTIGETLDSHIAFAMAHLEMAKKASKKG